MPAYVVAWLTVQDREQMLTYSASAPATVEKYGGRYLCVGSGTRALEGEWDAHGLALLEFPTQEDAMRWYESPEYRPLREQRSRAADSIVLLTPDR